MKIPFCLPYIDRDVNHEVHSCLNETGESLWIPRAIKWRSQWILELACNKRAKEIVGKITKRI